MGGCGQALRQWEKRAMSLGACSTGIHSSLAISAVWGFGNRVREPAVLARAAKMGKRILQLSHEQAGRCGRPKPKLFAHGRRLPGIRPGFVGDEIQVAFGVGIVQIDRWRIRLPVNGQGRLMTASTRRWRPGDGPVRSWLNSMAVFWRDRRRNA